MAITIAERYQNAPEGQETALKSKSEFRPMFARVLCDKKIFE